MKSLVENETGNKIKLLILDNWGEYMSKDIECFYKEARIKREMTFMYHPWKNEIVE